MASRVTDTGQGFCLSDEVQDVEVHKDRRAMLPSYLSCRNEAGVQQLDKLSESGAHYRARGPLNEVLSHTIFKAL